MSKDTTEAHEFVPPPFDADDDLCRKLVPSKKTEGKWVRCYHVQSDPIHQVDRAELDTARCVWTLDPNPDYEVWEAACCGQEWQFTESGPIGNGMKFCCFCSKPLEEVVIRHDDDED